MRVAVLAENLHVFKSYIEHHKLNQGHFDYITGESSIRGRRGAVVSIGKWWRNPNYRNEGFVQAFKTHVDTGNISLVHSDWDIQDNINLL